MKKKICVVTGSRSDYGLLYPLLKRIKRDNDFILQLAVTGMHLSSEFGSTYREITKDGFKISEKIYTLLPHDDANGMSKSIGLGIIGFTNALDRLKPSLVVLLGDRFETFAAAIAAYIAKIPIAHISGGETTMGAIDEAIRHSITKMSYLHFASTDVYRKRIIQLGEAPKRVFNVGELGLENIKERLLCRNELEKQLGFKFGRKNILVTFHPVTLDSKNTLYQVKSLLAVIEGIRDLKVIFTKCNADAGGRQINNLIERFVNSHKQTTALYSSLGRIRYLSTMQYIDAIVGNSSSGIVEAPSFKIGTINIGDRQEGRVKTSSVITCKSSIKEISLAFKKLYSTEFQSRLKFTKNPFEGRSTATKILSIIKKHVSKKDIVTHLKKKFFDLNV